ncbi:MAG: DnaA regulatory inactivator Hda [Steroidobacteraceae bacterium]
MIDVMATETRAAPRQLSLPIRLRASSVFNSYHVGPNADVIAVLTDLPSVGPSPVVFVYGGAGVGKTHLLQALCARAGEQQQQAAYLPLRELHAYGPELLAGAEVMSLVCLDDIGMVLRDGAWNRALFSLHRELEERGGKLVLADEQPPAAIEFALKDLSSRVLAGTVLRVQALLESDQIAALRLHARQRGLELPDDVAAFLLRRLPRDMSTLCAFLDELDVASLAEQRKLTIPFVKHVWARQSS